MFTASRTLAASTLLVATMAGWVPTASAAPVIDHLAIKNASASTIDLVQWRDGMGMGMGMGAPAVAGGVLAGALLGSALAAPYYYGPGPYYPYYPRPIMHPRPPAITLRAMVLRQVGTRSPTARNASDHTIRGAELISGQTATAIHALDRCKTVILKLCSHGANTPSNGIRVSFGLGSRYRSARVTSANY